MRSDDAPPDYVPLPPTPSSGKRRLGWVLLWILIAAAIFLEQWCHHLALDARKRALSPYTDANALGSAAPGSAAPGSAAP